MEVYKNVSGSSSVVGYELSDDAIHVVFASGRHRNYLYSHRVPGRSVVDRMKQLAVQGYGLNSYISTVVKGNYDRKW